MRKHLITWFVLFNLVVLGSKAQSSKVAGISATSSANIHLKVYNEVKKRGDATSAILSLNYLLASDDGKYQSYADTLAQWYISSGSYVQGQVLIEELLKKRPQEESLLAMQALCLRVANRNSESAEVYQRLFNATKKYIYGVELVQLQWTLQRMLECQQTCQALRQLNYPSDLKLQIPTPDNKSQEPVSVPAFAWYMEGITWKTVNQLDKAKEAFTKALSASSPFSLASFQLAELDKTPSNSPKP